MSSIYVRKIEVKFSKEDSFILDGQSKICNWLYNQLLDACRKEYQKNGKQSKLLYGRNLRDYGTSLKATYPFLQTVFSSVLKEPSTRLKHAYEKFFRGEAGYPKYRSWKERWFSLVFDEPKKGWEVKEDGKTLSVSLGNIPNLPKEKGKQNPSVLGKLKEKLEVSEKELLKLFSLVKQQGRFYAVFTIERCSKEELEYKEAMCTYRKVCNIAKKEGKPLPVKPIWEEKKLEIPKDCKWIALDPNHKNFFVGVDDKGESIEFQKLQMIKYWDKTIDKLKAKRDLCEKNYRTRKSEQGNRYTVHSPRWNKMNQALQKAYQKRREQIKTALYTIAHWLYRKYDIVLIGDYVPTNETACYATMKRSMLNQEEIGQFRKIVNWVAEKEGKYFIKVNEKNTTKECCVCGDIEKKGPEVREFTCKNCGTKLKRDINSAVNIGKKAGYSLEVEQYKEHWSACLYQGSLKYGRKVRIR